MTNSNESIKIIETRESDGETYALRELPDDTGCLKLLITLQRDAANELLRIANRDLEEMTTYPQRAQSILDAHANDDENTKFPLHPDWDRDPNSESHRMTQFDYSGDHDDYNPAASGILHAVTSALVAHIGNSPSEIIRELYRDDDFMMDASTASFASPLLEYFLDSYDLEEMNAE